MRSQQKQGIEVSVYRQDTGERIGVPPASPGLPQEENQKARRECSEQEEQGITAGFLRVAEMEIVQCEQSCSNNGDFLVEHQPCKPIDHRNADCRENNRQASNKEFRRAELQPDP